MSVAGLLMPILLAASAWHGLGARFGADLQAVAARKPAIAAAGPAVSLSVTYTPSMAFGAQHYTLRCDPASGTMPHARAACRSLAKHPEMALAGRGYDHSCPPSSSVTVKGDYRGRHVDVTFSACISGQGGAARRWGVFLPPTRFLDRVRLGSGLGPLRLGEMESTVKALLGTPTRQRNGLDVYMAGWAGGFSKASPVYLAVGYGHRDTGPRHARRIVTLISNSPVLTLGRTTLASPRGQAKLKRWAKARCGGRGARVHLRPRDGRVETIVRSAPDHPTAIVTTAPGRACRESRGL